MKIGEYYKHKTYDDPFYLGQPTLAKVITDSPLDKAYVVEFENSHRGLIYYFNTCDWIHLPGYGSPLWKALEGK
jgi:hypothetical protein